MFPRRSRSVLGKLWFFWLLMFMNSATSVKFDAGHRAVVVLLGLGAILVLALARMPLLKLYWQRATSVVSSCVCYLAQICANISTAKGSWVRITTWDSHQLAGYKMVLSRDHVVQKRWSCEVVGSDQLSQGDPVYVGEDLALTDCWFDISWTVARLSSSTPAIIQW